MRLEIPQHQVTLSGNTAGGLAALSSGTVTLAGGNNITLSQVGNAVTISGPVVGGAQTGISGIANSETTYTSGTVSLSVVAGNLTIRSTTGQAFQFSMSQTVQPETQTAISGIANSQTTYTSGTVSLSELGAITIRSTTGNQFQFSVNSQTAQTGISGIANSQTTYTSGTVSLSELGAITIRSTTGNQYQLSVNAQTTQTQGILSAGVSTGGNTAGNTTVNTGSRFVLVASGNATASQATAAGASTVTISVGTQTVQTQGILSAGVSTGGNTSGDTTVNTGSRIVFVGSNNITLSQGTAAGATTVTISGPTVGGVYSAGMSTNGNTSGDTGYATQRLNLVGGNNITLSGSTNAGSMSITISAPNLGAGAMSAGASNLGNTAGSTGITGTQLVLVGTGPVSLSQSTGANGGTLSINAPATSSLSATGNIQISTNGSTISIGDGGEAIDFWDNMVPGASTTFQLSDAALHIYPLNPSNAAFPGYMSVSSMFFDMSGTVSTAAPFTRSLSVGFYTRVNSTQLSLSASASTSWGTNAANMNVNDSMAGRRWVTLQSSQFNNAPNFSHATDYFMAVWHRSSSGSQTFNFLGQLLPYHTGIRSGFMSAASATNTTNAHYPFLGNYSVSFTTAMPNALAASDVNKSNATAISLPRIIFNNVGSQIL